MPLDTFDRDALLRWGDESPAFIPDPQLEETDDQDDEPVQKLDSPSAALRSKRSASLHH